jgi:hypothetical protein
MRALPPSLALCWMSRPPSPNPSHWRLGKSSSLEPLCIHLRWAHPMAGDRHISKSARGTAFRPTSLEALGLSLQPIGIIMHRVIPRAAGHHGDAGQYLETMPACLRSDCGVCTAPGSPRYSPCAWNRVMWCARVCPNAAVTHPFHSYIDSPPPPHIHPPPPMRRALCTRM